MEESKELSIISKQPKKSAEDLNIEQYEKIFQKCFEAAERITTGRTFRTDVESGCNIWNATQRLEVAKAIFSRYCEDQATIQGAERQVKLSTKAISDVLESRGRA